MTAPELVHRIEAAGGVLTLRGDRIRYELPEDAAAMVEVLRQLRTEVVRVLRERERQEAPQATRWSPVDGSQVCEESVPDLYAVALEKTTQSSPPPMPKGVRLLRWAPQLPPVAIESWAIVNDVPKFIQTTLCQLQAAMAGTNWLAGNWSVRELVERLEQVGVKVSVEGTR
jgi:hypothetical protein